MLTASLVQENTAIPREGGPPIRNPYLCILLVAMLGLIALGGLAGIIGLAACGKPVPESLIAIASGASGGLGSFLVMPPKGSVGGGDLRREPD